MRVDLALIGRLSCNTIARHAGVKRETCDDLIHVIYKKVIPILSTVSVDIG